MIYYYRIPDQNQPKGHTEERALAYRVLAAALKREYGMETLPEIGRQALGKPFFKEYPEIQFNYSHCKKEILCGLAPSPVGVDVEGERILRPSLVNYFCHPEERKMLEQENREQRILDLWVAKEAYLKYLGKGIRESLREMNMSGVLQGEEVYGGAFIRLWENRGMHRCACCMEREHLKLVELEEL